jgi:hypothetical protein
VTVVDSAAGRNTSKLVGTVAACLIADGGGFVSRPVETLTLDFIGIVGDRHAGVTRRSTSREPWYPRGTEIRNDRQLTVVSREELEAVAFAMEVASIEPAWIGANLVFSGVADLSGLPPRTRLFFRRGVTLVLEAGNGPCRTAGRSIAGHYPERNGLDLAFPRLATNRRGVVASVEKPGTIAVGEEFATRPW